MSTRIKICGITSIEDMQFVARTRADAIGLVFAGGPRQIGVSRARAIIDAAPATLGTVALFMNNRPQYIEEVLQNLNVHLLQFHGQETAEQCTRWGLPYIKALPMSGAGPAAQAADEHPDAFAYLLDAHRPGGAGGTGEPFDWERVPSHMARPVILAGGLNADNVGDAVRQVAPYAVDVSSGVEIEPGIKDENKVKAFTEAVRRADERADESKA